MRADHADADVGLLEVEVELPLESLQAEAGEVVEASRAPLAVQGTEEPLEAGPQKAEASPLRQHAHLRLGLPGAPPRALSRDCGSISK